MRYLALIILLLASPALAADKPCAAQIYSDAKKEPDYECPSPHEDSLVPKLQLKASVELKLKAPAPWSGILMDKERVIVLGLRIKALRRLRWQDMRAADEKLENERSFLKASGKADLDLARSQRDNYKQQVVEQRKEIDRLTRWYRSPTFWFVTGMVVTAAGATALAFGLRK